MTTTYRLVWVETPLPRFVPMPGGRFLVVPECRAVLVPGF